MKSILRSIERSFINQRIGNTKTNSLVKRRPRYLQSNHAFASTTSPPPQQPPQPSSPSSSSNTSTTLPPPSSSPSSSTANTTNTTTSVSQNEVSKFSSLASSWWNLDDNPLVTMNPVRMSFIRNTLSSRSPNNSTSSSTSPSPSSSSSSSSYNRPFQGLRALDVGCGGGLLSESLSRLGATVTAIDPSVEVANAARDHSWGSEGDEYTRSIDYRGGVSVEDLAAEWKQKQQSGEKEEEGGLFDIVCVLEVIEHTTSPRSLLQSACSLLKPPSPSNPHGGTLFVSTMNRTAKSYALTIVGAEYVTGKLPVGTHDWNLYRSPEEVKALVRDCSGNGASGQIMDEVGVSGMVLKPPFLWDMEWELVKNDMDVNWIGAYGYTKR